MTSTHHPTDDGLYNWSRLRSQYLAEANNQIAGEYADMPGFNPGWYWDPWMWDYTYLGWDPFFSPFGWGFYPWGGFYGGYGGYGFYGGRLRGRLLWPWIWRPRVPRHWWARIYRGRPTAVVGIPAVVVVADSMAVVAAGFHGGGGGGGGRR